MILLSENSLFLHQDTLSNVEERMAQGMTETIDVYYQGYRIDTKTFDEYFAIARDGNTVVWFSESEKQRGGAQVWITTGGGLTIIKTAGTPWTLCIDQRVIGPEERHSNLLVTGRTVEFAKSDYRFLGRFSGQPLGTVDDILSLRALELFARERRNGNEQ